MLRVFRNISCNLDTKVKVKGKKAGICDGVQLTAVYLFLLLFSSADFFFQDEPLKNFQEH